MAIIRKRNHRLLREGLRNRQSIRKSVKILTEQTYNSYDEQWDNDELEGAIENTIISIIDEDWTADGLTIDIVDVRTELQDVNPAIFDIFDDVEIDASIIKVMEKLEKTHMASGVTFIID